MFRFFIHIVDGDQYWSVGNIIWRVKVYPELVPARTVSIYFLVVFEALLINWVTIL